MRHLVYILDEIDEEGWFAGPDPLFAAFIYRYEMELLLRASRFTLANLTAATI